jgi:hypothetical protein
MSSDELNNYFRFVLVPDAVVFLTFYDRRQHAPSLGATALQKALAQVREHQFKITQFFLIIGAGWSCCWRH